MHPPYRDQEVLALLMERKDSVKRLMDNILKEFASKGKFTAEEVYDGVDGYMPKDLDMYLALSILEERGNIRALFEDDGHVPHDKMVYEASK